LIIEFLNKKKGIISIEHGQLNFAMNVLVILQTQISAHRKVKYS